MLLLSPLHQFTGLMSQIDRIMHPHPLCSTAFRLSSDTVIKLDVRQQDGLRTLIGSHSEKKKPMK